MGPLGVLITASILFSVQKWMQAGGYLVLFGLLFACGMGLPLPEDVPLMIGGFLVAKGHLHIVLVAIASWGGIIGGDLVLYHLGKRYGMNVTRIPFVGRHITEDRIRQAELLFERYGIWVIAVGRLFAGIRGAMVISAGAIRFNLVKFIIVDGLAAFVSGGVFVALGYWAGKELGTMEKLEEFRTEKIAGIEHWIILGLAAAVVAGIAYMWWRKRTHIRPSEKLLEKTVQHVIEADKRKHHDQT